jgi:hypothetical protein
MDRSKSGSSVYRVHAEFSQKRTMREKQAFNLDRTGKSRKIFKKIKAESMTESLLVPDIHTGIFQKPFPSLVYYNCYSGSM